MTFIDTSDTYPLGGTLETTGETEEILGRWLAERRQDFIMVTKLFAPVGPNQWDWGNSQKHSMDAVEGSL